MQTVYQSTQVWVLKLMKSDRTKEEATLMNQEDKACYKKLLQ